MTAIEKTTQSLELRLLPGEIFEAMHPAIDFNRDEVLRERELLGSRVVALLARHSRRDRDEAQTSEDR